MNHSKKHDVVHILSSDEEDDSFSDARSNHSSSSRVKRFKVHTEGQPDAHFQKAYSDAVDEPTSHEDIPLEKMDKPVEETTEITREEDFINNGTLSLKMECEEIPIELDNEDDDDEDGTEKRKKEVAEAMEPPEYFHVSSRTTIINKDLVMTCETICEEDDNVFGHSEDLSLTQAKDFEIKQNQHETYKKLLKERTDNNYNIKHLELTESDLLSTLLNTPVSSPTKNAIQVSSSGVCH